MTITVPQQDQALEARTREAWQRYADRLRDLSGAPYEQAERESWDELQADLAAFAADHALAEIDAV
jgi:hypothetical protein